MRLYYTTRSPYARKAMIMAEEKGVQLELISEDLRNKSKALLKANPVAKVPVLEADDGKYYCESQLICEYLEATFPEPGFIPEADEEKFRILRNDAIAKGLTDVAVSILYEKLLHPDNSHEGFIRRQEETVSRCLSYFEDRTAEFSGFWIDTVGLICALGYVQFRFDDLFKQGQYPKLFAWFKEQHKRPSVKETVPFE